MIRVHNGFQRRIDQIRIRRRHRNHRAAVKRKRQRKRERHRETTPRPQSPSGEDDGYCNGCFTGRYPIHVGDAQAKLAFEGVLA